MGLLLMQYEYQKAKQKCNVLELKGIRLHDQQELYTKRISNIEKLYSKKKTQLESKYSRINSQLSSSINNAVAMGTGFSAASIFSSLGLSTRVTAGNTFDTQLNEALTGEMKDSNGNVITDASKIETKKQSIMSAAANQLLSQLQAILEAIKEAELAQLEEMEDAQREPIAEKDAEIQADVAENDTLMTLAKERMEAAKGRLPDTVKGSVAHY
ncbi:MAG: hypothetical protein ACI4S3_00885 [Candidatus Gastranaerophilaceae bacterium]